LWFLSIFKRRAIKKRDITPSISIILCAFNEEKHIRQKIGNCLELNYPKDRVEIIVISDGSTDSTNQLLKEFKDPRIKIHCTPEQQGKTACQNLAAGTAKNDVLFFTDANVMQHSDALKHLVLCLYVPMVSH